MHHRGTLLGANVTVKHESGNFLHLCLCDDQKQIDRKLISVMVGFNDSVCVLDDLILHK